MPNELTARRVEVSFVNPPPAHVVERARGVSDVEIHGRVLRCVVCGSFQPFLEALRGHEVIAFESSPSRQSEKELAP
jgi:hypothetical protein